MNLSSPPSVKMISCPKKQSCLVLSPVCRTGTAAATTRGQGLSFPSFPWLAMEILRFYNVLYYVHYYVFHYVYYYGFPRLEIPGSIDFQLSPSRLPRILRSPSSRNPRFLVRASASSKTWFLQCFARFCPGTMEFQRSIAQSMDFREVEMA